jgi:hypothetical protein
MIFAILLAVFLIMVGLLAGWVNQRGAADRTIAARERRADFLARD